MFFSKKSLLGGILASRFGNRGPPLPPFGKTSQKIPYFIFKSDHGDNKQVSLNDDKVYKLIRYHLPTFVKHVFLN